MNKNILAVVAHPDDEVLGCGGTLAKLSRKGFNIHVLIIAEGLTSRTKKGEVDKKSYKKLHLATKKSSKILGIKSFEILKYPDNKLYSVDFLKIVKILEKKISILKPKTIFTHHSGDLNIDHQIVAKAVITSTRPTANNSVKRILAFETPSSTEWSFNTDKIFLPNYFENIEKTFNSKFRALREYSNEMRKFPHPRSYESISALAKLRGSSVGLKYAEAFQIIRFIKD
jgi:LmbE family N-acetylglucosaminyl deacetylase